MTTLTEKQIRLATNRVLTAEASDLGPRPDGEWPERVTVEFKTGRRFTFGEGRPATAFGIELGGRRYECDGVMLLVLE